LLWYVGGGSQIVIEFENKVDKKKGHENVNEFKQLLSTPLLALQSEFDWETHLRFSTDNKDLLKELMTCIHKFTPLDESTKKEIMQCLQISPLISLKEVIEILKTGKFEVALARALESENPDIIYTLGQYCQTTYPENMQWAIDCYQQIAENNPHFHQANQELLTVLMSDPATINNEDERIVHLEKLFYCAMNSGEVNSQLTKQYFHELCGYTDLQPKIAEVKGDYEVLINLAGQIRGLVKMNASLLEGKEQSIQQEPTVKPRTKEHSQAAAKKRTQSLSNIKTSNFFDSERVEDSSEAGKVHNQKNKNK
jgi:hypothetical protein